jgi:hypothetical protein
MVERGIAGAVRRMSRLCEEDRRCRDFGSTHNPSAPVNPFGTRSQPARLFARSSEES